MRCKLNYSALKYLVVVIIGTFSICVVNAEPINLPKKFTENSEVIGKFLNGNEIVTLEQRNNKFLFKLRLNDGNQVSEEELPWKPTHFEFHPQSKALVFASLKANGHQNARSILHLYKRSQMVLTLDEVYSFKLTNNGEKLFVLNKKNSKLTSQLYDLNGVLLSEREWGAPGYAEAISYSVSPNGEQFVPKPQSIDIERWTSIKSFSGVNHRLEREFKFGDKTVFDALAFDNDKTAIAVAGGVYFFQEHDVVWQFYPSFRGIHVDELNLAEDGNYILASDSRSNSFFLLNLEGDVVLEHYDAKGVPGDRKLSFLPTRQSQKGLSFNRTYEFRENYLILKDTTIDKVFVIDVKTKKHKILVNTNSIFDIDPVKRRKLIKSDKVIKDTAF